MTSCGARTGRRTDDESDRRRCPGEAPDGSARRVCALGWRAQVILAQFGAAAAASSAFLTPAAGPVQLRDLRIQQVFPGRRKGILRLGIAKEEFAAIENLYVTRREISRTIPQ